MISGVLSFAGSITMPLTSIARMIMKEQIMLPAKRPPTHPGEMLLQEFLAPLGMTHTALAHHLGWPYARLHAMIHGRRGI